MYVIGTAGHVDHGKSALVEALTGTDPDRLPAEKARGMTIDLGFASMQLPGGTDVSIIDVPGHERLVKNMLAGVGGIDLALLIVAADEGVMPQTREHLAILDLLGLDRGVIVITKSDLVEPDWVELVEAEVEELVAETTLAGSPIVRCSAVTGEGLETLTGVLESRLAETAPKRDLGRPRLPIDRVFTVAGFGTVVTGTLIDGFLSKGEEVEIVPAVVGGHLTSLRSRVRSLQSHGASLEQSGPGSRTAVNLGGIEQAELHRGQIVTAPGWLQASAAIDVRLQALESLSRPLRHNLPVSVHCLAAEAPGRLRLLDSDELEPGGEAWAQLRLLQPMAVAKGDRFIIRDANHTLGGGVVVETQARRHRRKRVELIESLERKQSGDPAEVVYAAVASAEPATLRALLPRLELREEQAQALVESMAAEGRLVLLGEANGRSAYTKPGFDRLRLRAETALEGYLKQYPLRNGLGREELRGRLGLPGGTFGLVLERLVALGALEDRGAVIAPAGWSPQLSEAQRKAADAYLESLRREPFAPPTENAPPQEVRAYLSESGAIVDVGGGVVFGAEAFEEMTRRVVKLLQRDGEVTMAGVRDELGSSRRYVQAFLEELDSRRVTMRKGDVRLLRNNPFEDEA